MMSIGLSTEGNGHTQNLSYYPSMYMDSLRKITTNLTIFGLWDGIESHNIWSLGRDLNS
jgi:hypothetical protein